MPLELLLQCCTTTILLSPEVEEPGDKVEAAFRTMDSDGDGYLILEDFVQIGGPVAGEEVDHGQLERIFKFCDQTGDGRVSLQEFRDIAKSNGDLTLEGMFE